MNIETRVFDLMKCKCGKKPLNKDAVLKYVEEGHAHGWQFLNGELICPECWENTLSGLKIACEMMKKEH